jgi:hypothetical protein
MMNALLKVAESLRRLLEVIALASGWLLVIMACVTTFDVVARKIGFDLPFTKLQELEWHFHAAIFSLWMGYCYTINAHPRVDSFTEKMTHRGRAWVELAGCLQQHQFRRIVLRDERAVRQYRRPDAPLGHQGRLRRRSLDGGAGHRQCIAARRRVPVQRQDAGRSQPEHRPC